MLMFLLLLGAVMCEVVGQVTFKLGLSGEHRTTGVGFVGFLRGLAGSPWIGVGIAVYALEFVLWFAALTLGPLSIAVAFAALSYCGVVLVSRIFLRERVGWRQWRATCTIAAGVVLVCWPHA